MKLSKKLIACLLAVLVFASFSFISSAKTQERCCCCISSETDAFASETDDVIIEEDFSSETDDDCFASGTDCEDDGCGIVVFFKNIINKIVCFFRNIFACIGLS